MKDLMQRRDLPAIRDSDILSLTLSTAILGVLLWGTFYCIPFWLVYSLLYTAGADSRWHEAGHRTAFKTQWMNNFVYQIAAFMLFRNPVLWRWSHSRHHTDTIIVGRDAEIVTMRPPDLIKVAMLFFGLHTEGFESNFSSCSARIE